jgi:site-specific DNA-methyltransferase (adenine-specific)
MKRREFCDGRIVAVRGDCLKVLPKLPDFDCCIMDGPYEAHMHNAKASARGRKVYGSIRRIRADGHADPKPVNFASIDGLREPITKLVIDKCGGWFLSFCTPEGIAPWRDAIEAAGARYKRACFFYKPDSAPQFNGQGPAFAVEAFVTAWCGRGVSKWNGGGRRNLFTHNTNQTDRQGEHPTEKPLSLMLELIELFTKPDDLICDPFMGSGTTLLAAAALGRRAVGIELDPKYYALACARIEALPMGRFEARAHIAKIMGAAGDAGPLFGGAA